MKCIKLSVGTHPFVSFNLWFMRLVVLTALLREDLILHVM